MNKQMEKDIKRREKLEKKQHRKRNLPTYKGYTPRNIFVFPLLIVFVEIDLFFESLFKWDEKKGRQFLEKNWMKVLDFLPDDEEYGACYYYDFEWREGIWRHGGKTPFGHRWGRKNGYHLTQILEKGWCPDGFKRVEGYAFGGEYLLFVPEKN